MGTRDVQVVIDCSDPRGLAEFWAAALGYVMQPPPAGFESWEEFAARIGLPPEDHDRLAAVVDPEGVKPRILFQKVPETKVVKIGYISISMSLLASLSAGVPGLVPTNCPVGSVGMRADRAGRVLDLAFTPVMSGSYPGAIISLEGRGAVPMLCGRGRRGSLPQLRLARRKGHRH
ncbi:MAG: VOC family protein, partial [Pseudonocardiaceae bacterium]